MTSTHARDNSYPWLWMMALCGAFLTICGGAWFMATHESGLSEAELRSDGYVDCSNWEGHLGIHEEAECIYEGELVRYYDTHYGAGLQRVRDTVELMD